MNAKETQDGRPLVFLAVLLSHLLIVLLAIRASRQAISSPEGAYEPLVVIVLRDQVPPIVGDRKPRAPKANAHTATPKPVSGNLIATPPVPRQPKIDWELEAELAAQNGVASAEKEKTYRDLSALSADQLSWIKRNRMEPMQPGIHWNHPRFEFDRYSGLPILWINDHCVLVTLMVFCAIGHIEANGDLFEHMRDPHDP